MSEHYISDSLRYCSHGFLWDNYPFKGCPACPWKCPTCGGTGEVACNPNSLAAGRRKTCPACRAKGHR